MSENEPDQQIVDDVHSALIEAFEGNREVLEAKDPDEYCNFVIQQFNHCDDDEKKIKEMAATMLKAVDNRRQAIQYVFGQQFRQMVAAKIKAQPGKKKSVLFHMGKAGFTKGREGFNIIDEDKAKKWMSDKMNSTQMFAAISGIKKTEEAVCTLFQKMSPHFFREAITGLNKTPFNDAVKTDEETGEVFVPTGCEIVPAAETFYPAVKPKQLPFTEPEKLEAKE